jgi:tRNA uridine 5-carbamoylmethylation protein Kti12
LGLVNAAAPYDEGVAADVLILTGAPGSGKTTVARLLTTARNRAVHLESDCFFHFITGGYIEPWMKESHQQNTVVMNAVASAAATYAHAGYFTVIDGIFSPRWFFPPVREALSKAGCSVAYAILRPRHDAAIRRARTRSSGTLSDPEVIGKLWSDFDFPDASWRPHIFDTTQDTPDETARRVGKQFASGALRV